MKILFFVAALAGCTTANPDFSTEAEGGDGGDLAYGFPDEAPPVLDGAGGASSDLAAVAGDLAVDGQSPADLSTPADLKPAADLAPPADLFMCLGYLATCKDTSECCQPRKCYQDQSGLRCR